ncbi:MAG: glycoside hydrolase 43 family protein [Prevotella sp.]|nr:glycoside hydrolase 43 family protein [Prevotella sp.]
MKRLIVAAVALLSLGLSNVMAQERIQNPMLWADVPDPDIIQVDGTFYLVSTTMHLMPGTPIMRSRDLKNWETVSYVYDRLTDSPKYDLSPTEGTVYGRGQWATSLKYHKGKFYVLFAPNEQGAMGDTYIYSADKAEGPWTLVSRMRHFHDCSLFFDDDDRVFVIYGTGELMELKKDLSDVIEGSYMKIFEREADETGLLEGSRMIKHNGKYYLQMISQVYAPGRHRREVCYRADDIHGPYEKNVILESDFGGFPYVGQGTIVDTPEGDWYGIIFQDRGGVGRVLTVSPVRWIDGWPMIGDEDGKVPETIRPYRSGQPAASIVNSDDFSSQRLGLHWQWNHNPVDAAWSLKERPGYLRLKTSRVVENLYLAPNTLTQRMEGPTCSGYVVMDVSNMRDGDCAGFTAFNDESGVLTIARDGKKYTLTMSEQSVTLNPQNKAVEKVEVKDVESVELFKGSKSKVIYLRLDADFRAGERFGGKDLAQFYYSTDGQNWTKIGNDYRMRFDWRRFFMGSKFGIFNYATKRTGGWVDVEEFCYQKGK